VPNQTAHSASTPDAAPYDALLLYSFGGPNGPDDVLPFLRNVTRGKNIPTERLAVVGAHYGLFGGRSPINGQNLALIDALHAELTRRGAALPIGYGNRNWEPYTTPALAELRANGATRVLAIVTSAYGSYSGCRQYRENLAASLAELAGQVGGDATPATVLAVDKLRHYFNHPGVVQANVDAVVEAYAELGGNFSDAAGGQSDAPLVFVTHSIPVAMDEGSGAEHPSYLAQHLDVAALIAAEAGKRIGRSIEWRLAFCSRSGSPRQPWLEPDVNDVIAELATGGARSVVLAPIGFTSDHMEVAFDLDTEALETARSLGLKAVRAGTVSTRESFVSGLVDLVLERAAAERGEDPERATVGTLGAWPDMCSPGCCRQSIGIERAVPAACGEDSNPNEWSAQ